MGAEQVYWCVFDKNGFEHAYTISYLRRDAIKKVEFGTYDWKRFKNMGFTVKKVTIKIMSTK